MANNKKTIKLIWDAFEAFEDTTGVKYYRQPDGTYMFITTDGTVDYCERWQLLEWKIEYKTPIKKL